MASRCRKYRRTLILNSNTSIPITELSLQYKDFSQWQSSGKHKTGLESQEQYWLHRFKEKPPDSDIFTDFPRPSLQSFAGEVLSFTLEQKLMEKIHRLTKETGTTLFKIVVKGICI
jgi:tyrocidine synthetase-3